jgi:hypothetical protein
MTNNPFAEKPQLHQRIDPRAKGLILKRLEFIEEGRDENGIDDHEHQVEPHPERPSPKPPQGACCPHQPKHCSDEWYADGE